MMRTAMRTTLMRTTFQAAARLMALGALVMAVVLSTTSVNSPAWADSVEGPELYPEEIEPEPTVSLGEEESSVPEEELSEPPQSPDGPSFVPAYYLFTIYTGQLGPCANRIGTYQGEYYVPRYHYDTPVGRVWHYNSVYTGSSGKAPGTRNYHFRDQGFTTAYRYLGCYKNTPGWGYYGAYRVSREKTLTRTCWAGGCNPGSWTYGPWRHGW